MPFGLRVWRFELGKVVATEFVSLDGVFEDPGGAEGFKYAGWTFDFDRGEDGDKFKPDELLAADAQLLGRITYTAFAKAWPSIKDEAGFADRMNGMPKYVVSATLTQPDWHNSHVIANDVYGNVSQLKERYAGDILIAGSGRLVRSLINRNLIDELRLMLFPVILGTGKRLFADTDRIKLSLRSSTQVGPDGIIVLEYEVVGASAWVNI